MLGRRSLIEYVRTSISKRRTTDRRSLIEYVRTTGHRGNARTSITYRICKDHITEVMLGRRSLIEYVRTSITYIEYVRTSITYRVCKDHRS